MDVDLGCMDSIDDPAGYFARARERGGDVQWSEVHRGWVVLSHAGVESGFREHELLSAERTGTFRRAAKGRSEAFSKATDLLAGWMNFRDPPMHERLREPVRRELTPRKVAALESGIRAAVEETIAAFEGPEIELNAAFCRPVPGLVIAALLGVDGAERHAFEDWSDELGTLVFAMQPGNVAEAPVIHATERFIDFFSGRIEVEQREPTGSLLSALVNSDADGLTPLELVGACTLLLFGGHETTATLLNNALAVLLERPALMDWLRDHPDADDTAVDEFMRTVGPARSMPRKVALAHERGGRRLEPGQNVFLGIAAANHDPEVFDDPGTLDLERTPNPHLGFGWGLHYCLGANLARLEARIALRTLLERYPAIQLISSPGHMKASAMGYGRRPLFVRLG